MNKIRLVSSLIFILFFLFGLVSLYAQDPDQIEEVDLEELMNGRVHKVDELLYSNLSFIQQTGDENQVTSIQQQQGQLANYSEIEQLNRANKAYVNQQGSGHNDILFQNGIENEANLWSVGENVKTMVWQEGDKNTVNSYIENYIGPSRSATFLQIGNNNNINVALRGDNFQGAGDQWIRIKQYGDFHHAEAIIEPFSTPIEIIQTPGDGEAGMNISISNSAFNFPRR